jgi:hypothetical protein
METVKKFYEAFKKDKQMHERAKELNFGQPQDKETAMAALITFAAKEGYSFTAEEAEAYFANKPAGEVTDEELDGVAGAGMGDVCPKGFSLWLLAFQDIRQKVDECRECPICSVTGKKKY